MSANIEVQPNEIGNKEDGILTTETKVKKASLAFFTLVFLKKTKRTYFVAVGMASTV